MSSLDEEQVLARARAACLEHVRNLNCWGSDLTDISIIRKCINLEVLSLSVNSVLTLEDASHCPRLKELYLRKNMIRNLDEIRFLKNLPRLSVLWLSDNPCTAANNYRATVIRNLPYLKKLDNIEITEAERSQANEVGSVMITSERESIPDYAGLHLEKTLTMEQLTTFFAKQSTKTPADERSSIDRLSSSANGDVPSKSVDIDSVNKRRAELGIKELEVTPDRDINMRQSSSRSSKPSSSSGTSTNPSQSNTLPAILLLLNDLDCQQLRTVIQTADNLLDSRQNEIDMTDGETHESNEDGDEADDDDEYDLVLDEYAQTLHD